MCWIDSYRTICHWWTCPGTWHPNLALKHLTLGKLFSHQVSSARDWGLRKYWTVVVELVVPQGLNEQDLKSP